MKFYRTLLSTVVITGSLLSMNAVADDIAVSDVTKVRIDAYNTTGYAIKKDKSDNNEGISKFNYTIEVFNDGSVSTKVQINENMNTWHGFDFGDIYYNPNFYSVEITDISGIEQNGVKVYTNDVFDNENYPNANGLDIRAFSGSNLNAYKMGDIIEIKFTPEYPAFKMNSDSSEDITSSVALDLKIFNTKVSYNTSSVEEHVVSFENIQRTSLSDFDVNFDGHVNAVDASVILRMAADLGAGNEVITDDYITTTE